MLKRLDRYILLSFLKNYVLSLVVLVGLYIMMDAFFNFDEFGGDAADRASGWELATRVATYYGAQGLFVYGQLAGVIAVVAAAFTLMRMSRFNELTALLAAGVPLVRVAKWVVIASLVIGIGVQVVNQELIVPRLSGWLTLDREDAAAGSKGSYALRAMPVGTSGFFDAGRFRPAGPDSPDGNGAIAEFVTIVEREPDAPPGVHEVRLITARSATYSAATNAWLLTDGVAVSNLAASEPTEDVEPTRATQIDRWQGKVTPGAIGLFHAADLSVGAGGSYFDLLSTRQLNELLNRPDASSAPDLLRAKHTRLSGHVMNVVLMLLAIPAVLTREPGQLRRAAGRTLLLVGSAMGAVFFCQMLARDPPASAEWAARWPAIMAWLPVFLFGPFAVALLDRMET